MPHVLYIYSFLYIKKNPLWLLFIYKHFAAVITNNDYNNHNNNGTWAVAFPYFTVHFVFLFYTYNIFMMFLLSVRYYETTTAKAKSSDNNVCIISKTCSVVESEQWQLIETGYRWKHYVLLYFQTDVPT